MPPLFRNLTTEEDSAFKRQEQLSEERLGKGPAEGRWWMPCPRCGPYQGDMRTCPAKCDEGWAIVDAIELREPCKADDHIWIIEFDAGSYSLRPKDPHAPVEREAMARWARDHNRYPIAGCSDKYGHLHEGLAGEFEIAVHYVDDSTASTPAGPAEYGYYYTFEVQ